jgi:hypothetical protein
MVDVIVFCLGRYSVQFYFVHISRYCWVMAIMVILDGHSSAYVLPHLPSRDGSSF